MLMSMYYVSFQVYILTSDEKLIQLFQEECCEKAIFKVSILI